MRVVYETKVVFGAPMESADQSWINIFTVDSGRRKAGSLVGSARGDDYTDPPSLASLSKNTERERSFLVWRSRGG